MTDFDICKLVHASLVFLGHHAICVLSSRDATLLLSRDVKAEFVLLDVGNDLADERLFDPVLLQMIRNNPSLHTLLTRRTDQ